MNISKQKLSFFIGFFFILIALMNIRPSYVESNAKDEKPSIIYELSEPETAETDLHFPWSEPLGTPVCTESGDQESMQLCSDGAGGAIIVWADERDGSTSDDIYAQRLAYDGSTVWADNGVLICNADNSQIFPQICSDGAGGAIITWQDYRSGSEYDIYAHRILANGSLHSDWPANGTVIANHATSDSGPVIVSDGVGGAIIAFRYDASGTMNIYANRVDANGSIHSGWSANGEAICTSSYDTQAGIAICSNGAEGAYITWYENRGTGHYDVFVNQVTWGGSRPWGNFGTGVGEELNNQMDVDICSDGAGGAIIVWSDQRKATGWNHLYAQRVDSTGADQWTGNGTVIANVGIDASDDHLYPRIISDGLGGAIIAWEYAPSGAPYAYAQRINSAGASQWTANGTLVCDYGAGTEDIELCSDGAGGAIILFSDSRSHPLGYYYYFAQHITYNEDRLWDPDGLLISDGGTVSRAMICSDGQGGAIIAWKDQKASSDDIYAERISPQNIEVCTEIGAQQDVALCTDNLGGAIVVWRDGRVGGSDIYAQRYYPNGTAMWTPNGTLICNAIGTQDNPYICTDGWSGAFIVWRDQRSGDYDIYAQWIGSNGVPQWTTNGTVICNAVGSQLNPDIISDDNHGAIISWHDERNGGGQDDIYAQRIDFTETTQWDDNGTVICDAANSQVTARLCSDGAGGAIIAWQDQRSEAGDIYAQRIDNTGATQWQSNGRAICGWSSRQFDVRLCTDEAGGAILTWQDERNGADQDDNYMERIDSDGNRLWNVLFPFGEILCDADGIQTAAKLVSDGEGGAVFLWKDQRSGEEDLYVQKVNSTGDILWDDNGTLICNAVGAQGTTWVCSDGNGGIICTWQDERLGPVQDGIYAQRVDYKGNLKWDINGSIISEFRSYQEDPYIFMHDDGNAVIGWEDRRNGNDKNIYIRFITHDKPYSNSPSDITTDIFGSETIDWILGDDWGGGQYRVWLNDTIGGYFLWKDWTEWTNGSNLQIDINRTYEGIFNYTIEYYDDQGKPGITDTVIVNSSNIAPTTTTPSNIYTNDGGTETINWSLSDSSGGGQYRVIANNSVGGWYTWVDWTPWTSVEDLYIPINRSVFGMYNYTIEYNDDQFTYGIPHSVIVNFTNEEPTSTSPNDILTLENGAETINWTLTDDNVTAGQYRVWANNSLGAYYVWEDWTSWNSVENLYITINRTAPGIFNYTIEFYDHRGLYGISDMVIVNFTDQPPTSNSPSQIQTLAVDSKTINWTLSDLTIGQGQYRVWANNSLTGNLYVWQGWTPWNSVENLYIPINRTLPGFYNYTIEFYDEFAVYGLNNSVLVEVVDSAPNSNAPGFISTDKGDGKTIDWRLYDDYGTGQYRVWANNSLTGNMYVWQGWKPWTNGTNLAESINRTRPGDFKYIIQYNDSNNNFGINNTVYVRVNDNAPTSNSPADDIYKVDDEKQLCWYLSDDYGAGMYRVTLYNQGTGSTTTLQDWIAWTNPESVCVDVESKETGTYIYTLDFNDSAGNPGQDQVTIKIEKDTGGGDDTTTPTSDNTMLMIIIIAVGAVAGVSAVVAIKSSGGKSKKKARMITDYGDGADKVYIFVSYATVDSKLYQIPKIADILSSYPEIDEVLYWEEDMHDDIFAYMEDNLKRCKLLMLFCSASATASEPVKMEWSSALKLERKVIPVFLNAADIPALLTTKLGVEFDPYNLYGTIENIYQMILKKLELPPKRNMCNYIVPKEITGDQFEQQITLLKEQKNIIDTPITPSEAFNQIGAFLQSNNFYMLKKDDNMLYGYAEYKYDKIKVACTAEIVESEGKASVVLKTLSEQEWLLTAITNSLMRRDEPKPQQPQEGIQK